jgi:arabinofuranosyltransferase
MSSRLRPENWGRAGRWLAALLAASVAVLLFVGLSRRALGPGFPLDDAWIHQTYGRNLAHGLGWTYQQGQPSAGSSSPLWTMLLVPGRWLGLGPVTWVAILAVVSLAGLAMLASDWLARGAGVPPRAAIVLAMALPLEWHMVWAALSGMETLLAGLLALLFFWALAAKKKEPLRLGVLAGLGMWIRPDLLSLVVPAVWCWWFEQGRDRRSPRWLLAFGAGLALAAGPYLVLQEWLAGRPWPSTLYSKQAEYASLRQAPLVARWLGQLSPPLVGVLVVMIPGIVLWVGHLVRKRAWSRLAPLVWVLVYTGAFALRLPVAYQHGRYAMPVVPVLFVLGAAGMHRAFQSTGHEGLGWVVSRGWAWTSGLVLLAFLWIGGRAYAVDVAIIQSEMVRTARWVRQNTPAGAVVAAHDIGAVGYFSDRRLLDLAGLVSPEVIPILRDEEALAALLDRRRVDYLITFPSWYPELVRRGEVVYSTGSSYAPAAGGDNMAVYRWSP